MNLNIEGTKHEKAVLVILSYVVGFTAGFIVFGVTQSSPLESAPIINVTEAPAAEMVTGVPEVSTTETPELETSDMSQQVMYTGGRLMANSNGASVLLSAQIQTVDPETAKDLASQGVHESLPQYLASDDGNFIYYCEQHSGEDTCVNFIYQVSDQSIKYVTADGVKLRSTPMDAKAAYWEGATLVIGANRSMTPDTPWKLSSAQ
ncbi:hypothetical protein K2P47_03260 [Patescibacteria group bacterium]|nr:hypothetical protein [Patescibacteria group bacterium]